MGWNGVRQGAALVGFMVEDLMDYVGGGRITCDDNHDTDFRWLRLSSSSYQ